MLSKEPTAVQAASIGWAEAPQSTSEAVTGAQDGQDRAVNGCAAAGPDPVLKPRAKCNKSTPVHVSARRESRCVSDLESGLVRSTPNFERASPSAMPASVVDGDGEVPNKPAPRRTSMWGGRGGQEGKGRRASMAILLDGGAQAATHLAAGASTVSSLV